MIHKIVSVVSVGKYRSYNATGDVAFKKLTLFYGDNGGGKTTLTTIFRSVAANDPGHVKRRKSINETTPQRVQIVQRPSTGPDTHYTYNHITGWSNKLDNVEIFDIHFINDNIYSGFNFSDDHKRHLHQFVIGAQAVTIQQQMDQNKTDKSTLRQSIATIEHNLVQNVGNNLTTQLIPSFLIIDSALITNIDTKIAEAEAKVVSANANSVIQTLPLLQESPVVRSGIDLDLIDSDLQTTSQTIQNGALQTLF